MSARKGENSMADETAKFTLELDASSFIKNAKSARESATQLNAISNSIDAIRKAFKEFGASNAEASLQSTSTAINTMADSLTKLSSVDFTVLSKNTQTIHDFAQAISSGIDTSNTSANVNAFANAVSVLNTAFKAFGKSDASQSITTVATSMGTVNELIRASSESGINALETLSSQIGNFISEMNKVETVGDNFNGVLNALERLSASLINLQATGSVLNDISKEFMTMSSASKLLEILPVNIEKFADSMASIDDSKFEVLRGKFELLATALSPLMIELEKLTGWLAALGIEGDNASKIFDRVVAGFKRFTNQEDQANKSTSSFNAALNGTKIVLGKYLDAISKVTQKLGSLAKNLITGKAAVNSANQSFAKMFNTITKTIAKVGVFYMVIRRLSSFMKSAVNEAANYVEQLNLFTVATQSATGKNTELARSLSETTYGLNSSEFMQYQGSLNMLATGMGVVNNKSLIMSRNLAQLTYDYSSLFNIKPEEVFGKISNAMAGQTKGLKELGNAVTNQMIKQTGLKYGLKGEVSSWDTATQAMMRYETIMSNARKTGVYNDLARSINTPANAIRVFTNQVNIMKRALGGVGLAIAQSALPYLTALLKVITELANRLAKLLGYDVSDQLKGIDFSGIDYGDAEENIDNIGKSADETSKKLRKMLLPFDELNVMQEKASKSGSDAGSGLQHLDPSKWDPSNYEWKMPDSNSRVDDIIKNMKDAFKKADWTSLGEEFGNKLNNIVNAADDWIVKKFNPFAKRFGQQLATWLNGAIGKTNFKKIGQTVAHGLNGITAHIQTFFDNFDSFKLGTKLGDLLDGFFDYDFDKGGKMIGSGLNEIFEVIDGFAEKVVKNSSRWGSKIAGGINKIFETWDPSKAATATVKLVNGLINLFGTTVDKLKPDLIREKITTYINKVITGVDAKKFGTAVGTLVHNIMDTLGDVNWEELGFKVGQFLGSINWVEIMTTVGGAIFNALKGAILGFFDSAGTDAIWQLPAMILLTRGKAIFTAIPWDSLISAGAFNGLASKIQTSLSGIATNLKEGLAGSRIGQAFESSKTFWSEGFAKFGDKAAVSLETLKTGVTGKLSSLGTGISGGVGKIKTFLANSKLGGMIGNAFGNVSSAMAPITSGITSIFSKAQGLLGAGISGIGSFLASPAGLVILGVMAVALIAGNWDKISDFLTGTLPKIVKILGDIIGGITKTLASLLGTLLGWLVGSIVKGLAAIPKAIIEFSKDPSGFLEAGANMIAGLLKGILDAIAGIGKWIWDNIVKPFVDAFCEALGINSPSKVFFEYGGYIVQGLIDGIKSIINFVLTPFKVIWDGIKAIFSVVGKWFGDTFKAAYQAVVNIFSPIGSFFSGAWTGITNALSSVASWFGNTFQGAYDKVTEIFGAVGSWFADKYNSIKSAFNGIGSWFSSTFKGAYNNIKTAFSGVKKFFQGIWNGIKTVFKGVGTFFKGVFDAVLKPIKGVFNIIRKVLNTVIKALNKISIDVPDWVPLFGGKTWGFDIPEVPALATGGVVKNATTALVGEAGPEAVVPLKNDKAGIMQIAGKLAEYINGSGNNEALLAISKSIDNLAGNTYRNVTANSGYDTANDMNSFGNYIVNIINLVSKQIEIEQRSMDNDAQLANQIIEAIRDGRGAQVIIDGREVFNTVVKENNRQIMRTGNSPLGSK
jgi:phage-related protein